jgi:hypothetical protein
MLNIVNDGWCNWNNVANCASQIETFFYGVPIVLERFLQLNTNPVLISNLTTMYSLMNVSYQRVFLNIYYASGNSSAYYNDYSNPMPIITMPNSMSQILDNLVTHSEQIKNTSCYIQAYVQNFITGIFSCGTNFNYVNNIMLARVPFRNFSLIVFLGQARLISFIYLNYVYYTNRTCQFFGNYLIQIFPVFYGDDIVNPNWYNGQDKKHNQSLSDVTQHLGYIYLYMYDIMYIFTIEIAAYYNSILIELVNGVYTVSNPVGSVKTLLEISSFFQTLIYIIDVTYNSTGSTTCAWTASVNLVTHIVVQFSSLDLALYTRLWRLWQYISNL